MTRRAGPENLLASERSSRARLEAGPIRRAPFLLVAVALAFVAVAPGATAETTETHPLEVPGRWTPYDNRGLTFRAQSHAGYSSQAARSGSLSARVGFEGIAGGVGQDYGTVGLERVVPLERVDELAFSFKVTRNDVDGHAEKLKAGVGLALLGPDGQVRDRVEYWVATWHSGSPDRPAQHEGVVKVSKDPATDEWHTVSADPVADTPVDWEGTHGVRVTIFTAATWTAGDAFTMYVDDLRVAGPASDDPAPAVAAGGSHREASEEVPGVATPHVHSHTVTTPAVDAPATCTADPCREGAEVTVPKVAVDRTCVPLAVCAGPISVGEEREAAAPPACEEAPPACRDEQRVLDRHEATTPAVASQEVDPGARAWAGAETPAAGVGQPPLMANAVGPFRAEPTVPMVGPVGVSVCPFRCPVPGPPALHADTDASAVVGVQAAGHVVRAGTALP